MKKTKPLLVASLVCVNVVAQSLVAVEPVGKAAEIPGAMTESDSSNLANLETLNNDTSSVVTSENESHESTTTESSTEETASSTGTLESQSASGEVDSSSSTTEMTEETSAEPLNPESLEDLELDSLENAVTVSSDAQFKTMWNDPTVTKITMNANITLNTTLNQRTTPVTLEGGGYTLRFKAGQLKNAATNTLTLSNIKINNQNAFLDNGSALIPVEGGSLVVQQSVSITATNKAWSNNPQALKLDGDLTVSAGAKLAATSDETAITNNGTTGTFSVEAGGNVTIASGTDGITRFKTMRVAEGGVVLIAPGSSGYGLSFSDSNAELTMAANAQLTVTTGKYGITNTTAAPVGTMTLADSAALTVISNGLGVNGFKNVTLGTPTGTGAKVDVTAKGGVGFTASTTTDSKLMVNPNSVFTVYSTAANSALSDFANATFSGAVVTLSASNYYGINNVAQLNMNQGTSAVINSKQAGLNNCSEINLANQGTKLAITTNDSGILTGNCLNMTEGAALKITATTNGIKDVKQVTLLNSEIVSNGTFTAGLLGQVWANLDYGITGGTDVTLAGNVKIGALSGSIYNRGTSPKIAAIQAANSVTLAGSGNGVYGGGYGSSSATVMGGISAVNVNITGNNNVVNANQDINPNAISSTGVVNTAAVRTAGDFSMSGSNNTLMGRGYSIVTSNSAGTAKVAISGDGNSLTPTTNTDGTSNAIDTNAAEVTISGNQNTLTALYNGIINWNTNAPLVAITGSGNKITATYANDDNRDRGVAINLSDSINGQVIVTGSPSRDRNEIKGYRYGIKSAAATKVGGTLELGGNTYVKSNSDMTAIAQTVNFTSGNVEMRYFARVKDDDTSTEVTAKKSVLWVGDNADMTGSQVNVGAGANVKLIGWGYMDKNNPNIDSNNISSPIHSSYEKIVVANGGTLGIESRGNAINWFRDRGSAVTMNRGFAQYIVENGGTLSLKSSSTNVDVSVVQKLASEPSDGKGNIEIQNGGSFIAEGSGGYVFDLPVGTTFSITNPRVLDLKNTSNRPVFSKQASSSGGQTVFGLNKTNISMWQLTTDLATTETTPDYSYDDVDFADITATGSSLLLSTNHSQMVTDFKAPDAMSKISRIRAETKGMTRIYYQIGADAATKTEFSVIGTQDPQIRYAYGTSVDTILKTQIKEPGVTAAHYRYAELTTGVSAVRTLINKYNIAETLPDTGLATYFRSLKGLTWDEDSMTAFENWRAGYTASNDSNGDPVYDNPVLKLKKIPFTVTLSESVDGASQQVKTLTGEYGDANQSITLGKAGYSAVVSINGGPQIVLKEGALVTLPVQFDFTPMTLEDTNPFAATWQWFDTAASDDTAARQGKLAITVTYTKGADIFTLSSVPDIDFGERNVSEEKFVAVALSQPLIVTDTGSQKKNSWKIQTQILSDDQLGTLPGSYLMIGDKKISGILADYVEKTATTGPVIMGDDYQLLSTSDEDQVQLVIPDRTQIEPGARYDYVIQWTLAQTP